MTGRKLSFDKELEVMEAFKIDANHFYLVRYLLLAKYEGDYGPLEKYVVACYKQSLSRDLFVTLQEKKILSKKTKIPESGQALNLKDLEFTDSFIKKYFKLSCEAGEELFEAYPPYLVTHNGQMLPAKNITSKVVYKSLDDFFFAYCKKIKFDPELHAKVMASLEYAKKNKLLQSGISEFVISEKWRDYIKLMEEEGLSEYVKTYDTTKVI